MERKIIWFNTNFKLPKDSNIRNEFAEYITWLVMKLLDSSFILVIFDSRDNYGFVTFEYTCDAFAAKESTGTFYNHLEPYYKFCASLFLNLFLIFVFMLAMLYRDRNKEKFPLVRRTSDHVRLTCPSIFSLVQKIVHRSTQNYKFRKSKHNNKTQSAASCNRLPLCIASNVQQFTYYSGRARVYKKTESCDLVSF